MSAFVFGIAMENFRFACTMAEQVAIKSGEAYKLPRFLLLFFISQIPHMPAITQKIAGMLVPKLFMLIAPAPISAAAAIKFITMQKIKAFFKRLPFLGPISRL
ncbi:MAG: hypothetical protein MSH10_08650 [Pygmaiobacter massiliensis]|nr:hypothetical protein [Pygmaiobacter massiliensis]